MTTNKCHVPGCEKPVVDCVPCDAYDVFWYCEEHLPAALQPSVILCYPWQLDTARKIIEATEGK